MIHCKRIIIIIIKSSSSSSGNNLGHLTNLEFFVIIKLKIVKMFFYFILDILSWFFYYSVLRKINKDNVIVDVVCWIFITDHYNIGDRNQQFKRLY